MATPLLVFFSSDARELYKADVYRALALPCGYVVHFRYQPKYLSDQLRANPSSLRGRVGVIAFAAGNRPDFGSEHAEMKLVSIRQVTVLDVEEDETLGLVHFYLELSDFCDVDLMESAAKSDLPPQAFASAIDATPRVTNWNDRVQRVASHYPKLMFMWVRQVSSCGKALKPVYKAASRSTQYELEEAKEYECAITLLDPEERDTGLGVDNSQDSIVELVCPPQHRLAAVQDTNHFPIQTRRVGQKEAACFTYLYDREGHRNGDKNPDAWRVELRWQVTRPWSRMVTYGGSHAAGALGFACLAASVRDWSCLCYNAAFGIIGALLVFVTLAYRYQHFDGK